MTRDRSDAAVIAFLAYLGIILAFGIDIVLPAFDEIRPDLGLDEDDTSISLLVTTYTLGLAFGQLIFGPLSDRFGRRPVLAAGCALYALGALASALSGTFAFMLVARVVWGLGGASPAVLRSAVARDLYEGDRMARVTTIVMAVFLTGPIFVPLIGELILSVAPWRAVMWAAVIAAGVAIVWIMSFGETLAPENRLPLQFRPMLDAAKVVVRTRVTIGCIAATTFGTAAFFIWLGSAQPIIDRIYGRADRFALFFAAGGVMIVICLIFNDRAIKRYGAAANARANSVASAALSLIGLVIALAAGGQPGFWLWFLWASLTNVPITMVTPVLISLALEPMGRLAGTASAILGFVSLAVGALLAALFDSLIDDSVTPMTIGYSLFMGLALAALLWARPSATEISKETEEIDAGLNT